LFGQRPASLEDWTGPETLAALRDCEGSLPVESWLHFALADLCVVMGAKASRETILGSWGFPTTLPMQATDAELLEAMAKCQ
jgi:hypothetical protein